jgi:hypothetical protein
MRSGVLRSLSDSDRSTAANGNVGQVPRRQKGVPTEEATPIQKETFTTGITKMF